MSNNYYFFRYRKGLRGLVIGTIFSYINKNKVNKNTQEIRKRG